MASDSYGDQSYPEQLYMLEFLVDHIKLTPEKILEIGSKPLNVRLKFLDFPTFDINEEEFWSSQQRDEKKSNLLSERKSTDGSLDFSAGKSCLFGKKPNELIEAMRSTPLEVGIYGSVQKKICSIEIPEVPICKSKLPLTGCLCDQVRMSMNDPLHLPKPYTLRNTLNLIDESDKPSGTILLFLRLTCLGKSIVTQFAIKEKSFLFKSSDSSNEFQCKRVPEEGEVEIQEPEIKSRVCPPEGQRKTEINSLPKPSSVVGLVSICQKLATRDGGPQDIVPPRKTSTRRIVEEKHNFREIPVKHPIQDATCVSPLYGIFSSKTSTTFSCGREHYSGLLYDESKNVQSMNFQFSDNRHLTGNPCTTTTCHDTSLKYLYKRRMRGGGPWNENIGNEFSNNKYRDNRAPEQSIDNLISGACKTTSKSTKPGCSCFGKTGTGAMGSFKSTNVSKDFGCSNEPCHGIDCMIRALKETQDFVASIGKGTGLAGLGLMDPSDSPYFGRDKSDALTTCGRKTPFTPQGKFLAGKGTGKKIAPLINPSVLRDLKTEQPDTTLNTSLTKTEQVEKIEELSTVPTTEVLEKSGNGPCGESECESKKKEKSVEEVVNVDAAPKVEASPKRMSMSKRISLPKTRKTKQGRKPLPGPAGDRASVHQLTPVKVSKRTMRLMSDYRNSRFCYGHKNCLDVRMRVPGNMGWLWNTVEAPGRLKPLLGWKPGAIPRFIWNRLQMAKKAMSVENVSSSEVKPSTPTSKGKRSRSARNRNFPTLGKGQWTKNRGAYQLDSDEVELPPTLHIHRRDGTYYVTMYPVKPVETKDGKEPEEEPKPLQFKITKNRDDPGADSSSTGSDMEIEFSPPAAINRYRKQDPVKNKTTQVNLHQILETMRLPSDTPNVKVKRARYKK